jgi:hypothetical protein
MSIGNSLRDHFRGLLNIPQLHILKTLEQFEPFVEISLC